jgi:hypothetical protein
MTNVVAVDDDDDFPSVFLTNLISKVIFLGELMQSFDCATIVIRSNRKMKSVQFRYL